MKYLKTFETLKYKYLSEKEHEILKIFVKQWIINNKILEKINKLEFDDFVTEVFNYTFLWENIYTGEPSSYSYSYTSDKNIYYATDKFCDENKIEKSSPARRNSLQEIMSELYYEFDIEKIMDNRLIGLLRKYEKKPQKFKEEIYKLYWDNLSDKVKNKYQWMIDFQNYNL